VTGCTRGECTSLQHNTCPNDRACYDSSCIDPCGPTFCGGSPCCNPTANCRAVCHHISFYQFHNPNDSCLLPVSSTPRSTTWLSAPARQGQKGNLGLDEEALAGDPQAHVPASPLEAEVWGEEALLALCQPLTRATFVNRTHAARTPNVTWELIGEGTQGLSALAREGTLVMPCAFA